MTLPTRDAALLFAVTIECGYRDLGIRPSAADIGVPQVLRAYADKELLTRAEWEATIDYEAAVEFALSEVKKGLVYTEAEYDAAMRNQVHGIVDAAVGEEQHD